MTSPLIYVATVIATGWRTKKKEKYFTNIALESPP